jgi:hypothetical protein
VRGRNTAHPFCLCQTERKKYVYTVTNYKTKRAFKEAVAAGDVPVFQPGPFAWGTSADASFTGQCCIEGPHYPEPHRWYAAVHCVNGVVPKGSKVK